MSNSYEKEIGKIIDRGERRGFFTQEERFRLGIDKCEKILVSLTAEERGRIKSAYDIMSIHDLFRKNFSLVEMMNRYGIPNRAAICKVLAIPPIIYNGGTSLQEEIPAKRRSRHWFRPKKEDVQRIVSMYEETPTHIIAKKFGTTQDAIRYILRREGIQLKKSHRRLPRLAKAAEDDIGVYYNRGYDPRQIADILMLDADQVRRCVQRLYGAKI